MSAASKLKLNTTGSKAATSAGRPLPSTTTGSFSRKPLSGIGRTGGDGESAKDRAVKNAKTTALGAEFRKLSLMEQERLLVDDLLSVLIGLPGTWISLPSTISDCVDVAHADMIKRILPLAVTSGAVSAWTIAGADYPKGKVHHALAAGLRGMLKDYNVLVLQLESLAGNGQLSLHKVWYYVQPSLTTLRALQNLISRVDVEKPVGGAVLNLIEEVATEHSGDAHLRELFEHLLRTTAAPYMKALGSWIYDGVIHDPYNEFMVVANPISKDTLVDEYSDAYWESRYTLRQSAIPKPLLPLAERILTAGKYVNVIREASHGGGASVAEPVRPAEERHDIVYSSFESEYVPIVDDAVRWASAVVLRVLMTDNALMWRLKSLKHYFLLDRGDFLVHFMDLAETELIKAVDEIDAVKLQSLLELALRTSSAAADPFKDEVICQLLPHNLIHQLLKVIHVSTPDSGEGPLTSPPSTGASVSGLEAFTFDFSVAWPLSLVINRKVLTKYQLIFRHLFHCKHVERALCGTWMEHKATKPFRDSLRASYVLRARMLHFVQALQAYMMVEVLEPEWHLFAAKLTDVSTLDDLLDWHEEMLDNALKRCMLTNPRLLKILTKLMSTCVIFANYSERFTATLLGEDEESDGSPPTPGSNASSPSEARRQRREAVSANVTLEHVERVIAEKGYKDTMAKFEQNFNSHLGLLLNALNSYAVSDADPMMLTLTARVNFNGFYQPTNTTGPSGTVLIKSPSAAALAAQNNQATPGM